MPTIQCPHCKHEARVPSLDEMGGKNVKCPACNQTFYVDSKPPEPATPDVNEFAFRGPVPEFSPPEPRPQPAGNHGKHNNSLFSPLAYDPNGATSSQRYPNLMRYVGLSETLITLLFRISMALVVIGFFVTEIMVLVRIGENSFISTLISMAFTALSSCLAALILWLWFIFYMAITEFVRVVVDIENNTRR